MYIISRLHKKIFDFLEDNFNLTNSNISPKIYI